MKSFKYYFCIIVLFSFNSVFGKSVLESIQSFEKNGVFTSELTFNKPISEKSVKISYINQTIQVDVPNAYIVEGKNVQRLKDSNVKSVFTYQPAANTLRSRIIYKKPQQALDLEGFVDMSSSHNKLIIRVHNPATDLPIKKSHELVIRPNDITSKSKKIKAENVIASDFDFKKNFSQKIENRLVVSADDVKVEDLKSNGSISKEHKLIKSKKLPKLKNIAKKSQSEENKIIDSESLPVFKAKTKKLPTTKSSFLRMIVSLIVIAVLAVGLTLFGKWWSKRNTKSLNNTKMTVLAQHYLGPKKSLVVVQVAGESILLGVTDHNINMIKSLSLIDDEVPETLPNQFNSLLDENVQRENESSSKIDAVADKFKLSDLSTLTRREEDQEISSIKNLVNSKLKGMRSI